MPRNPIFSQGSERARLFPSTVEAEICHKRDETCRIARRVPEGLKQVAVFKKTRAHHWEMDRGSVFASCLGPRGPFFEGFQRHIAPRCIGCFATDAARCAMPQTQAAQTQDLANTCGNIRELPGLRLLPFCRPPEFMSAPANVHTCLMRPPPERTPRAGLRPGGRLLGIPANPSKQGA